MKWNNGKERAKFNKEQAKLREQYLAAGMSEEQIQILYEYDYKIYKKNRIEAIHNQRIDFEAVETEDKKLENPLYKKFTDKLTVEIDYGTSARYAWIEEIDNEQLAKKLKKLPEDYLEILTELVIDGLTQSEIARKRNVSQPTIAYKISRIKNFFKNF